ncbi:S1C family serine protease [Bradyrhizobium erythrophlei]|uniref:PDZ domain-containing protein n=1 Tax=Bradyrhizobium erythrophlei TaxID=1437360 RepID=A0A1M5HIL0_9BRAD|nr:PDZ domain-containing protein [Bradyrhizobium erythrophlei]SHG15767.1 PDZ domain-containing protein [Bradyrhizobium erythrophlei]
MLVSEIGFRAAIPIALARRISTSLILAILLAVFQVDEGAAGPDRAALGLSFYDPDPEYSQSANKGSITGAEVREVRENGPADNAGIESGDRIVRLDDRAITKFSDLREALSLRKPGEVAEVSVVRDNATRIFPVTLEAQTKWPKPKSFARGDISVRGRSETTTRLAGTAILRVIALPVSDNCDVVKYDLVSRGVVLTDGLFYPGEPNLTRLTADQLTMVEVLLPAGVYRLRTRTQANCRYAITKVIRYLSEFGHNLEFDARLPPMILRRDAALIREIIGSGLYRYVDIKNFRAAFLDRLWGARRPEILKDACQFVRRGYGISGGGDDLRGVAKPRFELVLRAAERNYEYWVAARRREGDPNATQRPKPGGGFSDEEICRNVENLDLAQDAEDATHPRLKLTIGVRNTRANNIDTPMTSQVVVAKLERIIHRLYGYSAADVVMNFREGHCEVGVRDGLVMSGRCENSGYARAPVVQPENGVTGVLSGPLSTNLTPAAIEAALRSVIGELPKIDFLVQNGSLIQVKIHGSKNIIIKARSYWEVIYLDIVPSQTEVHAIIEPSYASGVGNGPPPDEAFKGNTEVDFPAEARATLQKIVNALARAEASSH